MVIFIIAFIYFLFKFGRIITQPPPVGEVDLIDEEICSESEYIYLENILIPKIEILEKREGLLEWQLHSGKKEVRRRKGGTVSIETVPLTDIEDNKIELELRKLDEILIELYEEKKELENKLH